MNRHEDQFTLLCLRGAGIVVGVIVLIGLLVWWLLA